MLDKMSYKLNSIKPLDELTSKDWYYLNTATSVAEKSNFDSSKRLGAVIVGQGNCLLCR
jgi:hypothetical protein